MPRPVLSTWSGWTNDERNKDSDPIMRTAPARLEKIYSDPCYSGVPNWHALSLVRSWKHLVLIGRVQQPGNLTRADICQIREQRVQLPIFWFRKFSSVGVRVVKESIMLEWMYLHCTTVEEKEWRLVGTNCIHFAVGVDFRWTPHSSGPSARPLSNRRQKLRAKLTSVSAKNLG